MRHRSLFLYSCICERFLYSHYRPVLGRPIEGIYTVNNEAAPFRFGNQTFVLDSHCPFICSALVNCYPRINLNPISNCLAIFFHLTLTLFIVQHSSRTLVYKCTEMKFLDISLTKDSSLLLQAIHNPFYWQTLKKTIFFPSSDNLYKKISKTRKLESPFCRTKNEGRKLDKHSGLGRLEFMPRNLYYKCRLRIPSQDAFANC